MSTVLQHIVAAHRAVAAADDRSLDDLVAAAVAAPAARDFRGALAKATPIGTAAGDPSGVAVIAEIKRRSPSKGDLAPGLDPGALAEAYEAAGARALSVLTDRAFFGGSRQDLVAARAAVGIPVLRKDFTVAEADVADARAMGADAVLLIVAALTAPEVARFRSLAADLGMSVLVEVHDEAELDIALHAGADLVGVNQRDLHTFAVDVGRAERLGALIPDDVVKVAESGISDSNQLRSLHAAGYHAVLVGERLVTAPDPGEALRRLVGPTARGV